MYRGPLSLSWPPKQLKEQSQQWILAVQLWEQLIYDTEVKARLLDYAEAALHFADAGVSRSVVTWNRVVRLPTCSNGPTLTQLMLISSESRTRK